MGKKLLFLTRTYSIYFTQSLVAVYTLLTLSDCLQPFEVRGMLDVQLGASLFTSK